MFVFTVHQTTFGCGRDKVLLKMSSQILCVLHDVAYNLSLTPVVLPRQRALYATGGLGTLLSVPVYAQLV